MQTDPLTWLEIDLAVVRANVASLKSLIPTTTKFLVVVKSNAYGHGSVLIAHAAVKAGADWLGVVAADEASMLRTAGISVPILVLGMTTRDTWDELAERNVRVTIADGTQLEQLEVYHGARLSIHLKVETGLGRLGFQPEELPAIVERIEQVPTVQLEGISSHFASVEEQDLDYTAHQLAEFERATCSLDRSVIRHIAATAAILQLPETHLDLVRAGIGVYGLWPSAGVRQAVSLLHPTLDLQPALSWRTKLVQVKRVNLGTSVGYGRTHVVDLPTVVGVLPIGYADGYDRGLSNRAQVLIRGQRCPIIGRVAMNMTMVDLRSVDEARVGDAATLIGRDRDQEITADDLATWADTINYEIVTRIPGHIPRKYSEA